MDLNLLLHTVKSESEYPSFAEYYFKDSLESQLLLGAQHLLSSLSIDKNYASLIYANSPALLQNGYIQLVPKYANRTAGIEVRYDF